MSEIINLENTPKIGFMRAIKEGFVALIKNRKPFLKMQIPLVLLFLTNLFLYLFLLLYKYKLSEYRFFVFAFEPMYFIFCILILYFLFKFFTGTVAITYLAKDIFENKSVQKLSNYPYYVKQHIKSYIKFYLFGTFLFAVFVAAFLCFTTTHISDIVPTIWFYLFFITITGIFWAFQDKTKSIWCLFDALITAVKTPKIWLLVFFLYIIFCLIDILARLFHNFPLPWFFNMTLSSLFLCNVISFIFTRVYFEIKK